MQNTDSFKRGTVDLAVLCVLKEKDMYGYEIVKAVGEKSDGTLGTRTFCLLSFFCRGSIRSTLVFGDGKSMVVETANFLTTGRNHFAKQCFSVQ